MCATLSVAMNFSPSVVDATETQDLGSVAVVHDYLNQRGGAERVVLEMGSMWPDAPIYTSLYRPASTFPEFGRLDVRTSFLDRLPVDRAFRALFAFYPAAFRSLGTIDADVVISSSSGWAHSVRTSPRAFHAVYCYTPARWLYGGEYMNASAGQRLLAPFKSGQRSWDRQAARRPDLYIAISECVRDRIKTQYGRDAPVVYPPVDIERFEPSARGDRLLVVSRLLQYKRVDVIVDAATRAGIGLDVVGGGPALADLRARAGPTVRFLGRLSDARITELFQDCRAFCLPGLEDFGITPVEANAAGKPVIAFAGGGALETIEEGVTGAFFAEHTVEAVLDALGRCDAITTPPELIAEHARRFSSEVFRERLRTVVGEAKSAPGGNADEWVRSLVIDDRPSLPATAEAQHPAVLMLGKGWFPEQLGGLDRYFRDLLEHLPEARGLVVGPAPGSPDRVMTASSHDAPLPARLLALWKAARTARGAAVVDAHFALYALVPMLAGPLRRLPAVVHFQGPWADENVAAGDGSPTRRSLRRGLERLVYRRAERVVVLSSAFRRILVERYRVSPWRVRVEPPGVDLVRFSPGDRKRARLELGIAQEVFAAVAVRRLVPRMGLDVLVEAWARALPDLPEGAQLLIAGEGPERGPLAAQIERLGLTDSVRLLGRIDDAALLDLYRAADVGVVPSRSFEGFGLIVIEAAACGTPTIVTQVGGLPEAVDGLDRSLVVAAEDPDALARRIVTASGPGGLPTRAATRRFAEGFSWEGVVQRHRAVLREAVAPEVAARPMRVVYLDHVAQLSGGEIALLRLLPHLDEVQPHVILAEDGPFADSLVQAGISTEVLAMGETARGLRKRNVTAAALPGAAIVSTATYIVRLAIRLRRLRPDLVHTNSLKAGLYGSVAARLAGVPMIWHVRDRISEDYLPKPAVRLVKLMTRRLTSAVIANSRSTMKTLDAAVEPIVLYSVFPDALTLPDSQEPRDRDQVTVGMIGRLAPWKGQDLFLRAFAEAFPSGRERCVLVGSAMFGDDEQDYEARLHDLTRELGIEDRVEFRGFRTDVWAELARLDILVHASLTPEPFGQVILEGMAAGVPVVAADAGGPAEIVHDGVNGVLYPMGDRSALAGALKDLAHDIARRDRLANGGLASLPAYHPDAVAERLQQLYRTIIDRDGELVA